MFGFRNFGKTNTSNGIEKLCSALEEADAVIIGAGAGLSTSAGFVYTGERFEKHFHDFAEKYHFSNMYSGGFYPFDTLEEYWVYWSRYIWINRYTPAPKPVYEDLLGLVKNKDYFVLTTNVDHQFQNAGFDKHRLYYPDLKLPTDEEPRYGKYGRIRKTVLQKHRYGLYLEFLLNSQLESDLSRGYYTKRQDKISDRDVK